MPEVEHWQLFMESEGELVEIYTYVRYDRGKVADFVFQLTLRAIESKVGDRVTVRRYDCSHGFPHCDVYNAAGVQIRKDIIPATSIDEASFIANLELRSNTPAFIREFRATMGDRR